MRNGEWGKEHGELASRHAILTVRYTHRFHLPATVFRTHHNAYTNRVRPD